MEKRECSKRHRARSLWLSAGVCSAFGFSLSVVLGICFALLSLHAEHQCADAWCFLGFFPEDAEVNKAGDRPFLLQRGMEGFTLAVSYPRLRVWPSFPSGLFHSGIPRMWAELGILGFQEREEIGFTDPL